MDVSFLFPFGDLLSIGIVVLVPGMLLARLFLKQPTWPEWVGATLAAGLIVPSIAAFTVALVSRAFMGPGLVFATAAVISLAAALALHRQGRLLSAWKLPPLEKSGRIALILTVLAFSISLLNYDRRHFGYACINSTVMASMTPAAYPAGQAGPDFDDNGRAEMGLISERGLGQRFGTTAIIATQTAHLGFWGFRWVYAALAALGALHAFLLAMALGGQRIWLGVTAMALAALHPQVLRITLLDENFMAFQFGTTALYYLIRQPGAAALGGMAAGAMIGIRHIAVGIIPAAWILLFAYPTKWRNVIVFSIWAGLMTTPVLLHNQATHGSVLAHPHFHDEVRTEGQIHYSFMGLEWDYGGLLNWPVNDTLVRTPYNPLPTSLYHPVYLNMHQGVLVTAAALLGLLFMARRRRRLLLALTIWLLPPALLLGVLENWGDPVKMGIPVTLFSGLVVAFIFGVMSLKEQWKAYLVLVIAVAVGVHFAARVRAPADPNFWRLFPTVQKEHSAYQSWSTQEISRLNFFPDFGQVQGYGPLRPFSRLSDVTDELFDRNFVRETEKAKAGKGSVVLALDLSRPWIESEFLSPSTVNEPALDLTSAGTVIEVDSWSLPWSELPARVRVVHQESGLISIFLAFGGQAVADMVPAHFDLALVDRPAKRSVTAPKAPMLSLRVPAGAKIQVVETLNLFDGLLLVWDAAVLDQTLALGEPRRLFHN